MRLVVLLFALVLPSMSRATPDIVILGEVHDNAQAHLGQAEALKDLRPSAVVFEMLTEAQAASADADRSQISSAWKESGWRDFSIYAPIFEVLGKARIIGAAVPRATLRAVYTNGAEAHFGPEATRYGLHEALPEPEKINRMKLQFEAHCEAMPFEMMAGMVTAQRFRDAAFARAALSALETYGPPVAVIAGNGHARIDWGVPAMIARAAPGVTTHAIGFVEGDTDVPFDEIRIVPTVDRDDPCQSLRTE